MQQTEKYKLNLIESSDPFLPEGLNQNTQKIEDAMTAHEAAVDARMDATDQRVAVLEGRKLVYGWYTWTNGSVYPTNHPVQLSFTPRFVVAQCDSSTYFIVDDHVTGNSSLTIIDGGFNLYVAGQSGHCTYLAIL